MDYKNIGKCLIAALFTGIFKEVYGVCFGVENILIAIVIAMAVYSLLRVDFTSNIKYNTVTLLILNLFLGVMAYVANRSPIIGIFINIFTIFIVCFTYVNEFQNPVSFMFLMLYIFMWSVPVQVEFLPRRLIALVVGVATIMAGQIIFNRNKFKKSTKTLVVDAINNIKDEINCILQNKYSVKESITIDQKLRSILLSLASKNKSKVYRTIKGKNYFNIVVALERLNVIVNEVASLECEKKSIKENYLNNINTQLDAIVKFIEKKIDIKDATQIFDEFIDSYKDSVKDNIFVYEGIEVIQILKISLNNCCTQNHDIIDDISGGANLIKKIKGINYRKDIFDVNSVRFTYSLRLAVAVSSSMFLVNYFNIDYGKWLVVTIYVLLQPYSEDTVIKAKKRLKGTIVGIIAIILIFYMFPWLIRNKFFTIFVLFMYYYVADYYKKVIFISALALSAYISSTGIGISFERLGFVITGVLIALAFNKAFLPYNIKDSIKTLRQRYNYILFEMIDELRKIHEGKNDKREILRLALECNLIESNLIKNIKILKDKNLEVDIYKQSAILSDIRFLILEIYYTRNKQYINDEKLSKKIIMILMNKVEIESKKVVL